ncbi:MAG: nucleoside kinase [Clostridia bacterium]|nr:nucleoside kinase [Clostridia bacterium]
MKRSHSSYSIISVSKRLKENAEKEIANAEKKYLSQIKKAAYFLGSRRIILISGPSASGKTTSANKICEAIRKTGKKCEVVSLDDFYHNREHLPIVNGKPNAEIVDALSVSLIHKTMDNLLRDGCSYMPKYDFMLGKRTNDASFVDIGSDGIIIFEGIHALNPKINRGLDHDTVFKIYISPHSDFSICGKKILTKREVRFIRRVVRDSWARNTDPETTMNMWADVCEGEDTLIRPFASLADMYINTTHSYEPFILKDTAVSLLRDIDPDSEHYADACAYVAKLEHFFSIPKLFLPEKSLLNEFINFGK